MRKGRNITLIALTLFFLCALILSYGMKGRFTLKTFSFDSPLETYSMKRISLSSLGKNILSVSKGKIKDDIEKLPYIESSDVHVRGTELEINAELKDEGLIISDGKKWYFYSESLSSLDRRDILPLASKYLILYIQPDLLSSFSSHGIGSEEKRMIDTLKKAKTDFALITKAEYDNNEYSVYSGSLTLALPSLNASLLIRDIRDFFRMNEAVEIIEEEYTDSRNRLSGEKTEYVLSDGMLLRMR